MKKTTMKITLMRRRDMPIYEKFLKAGVKIGYSNANGKLSEAILTNDCWNGNFYCTWCDSNNPGSGYIESVAEIYLPDETIKIQTVAEEAAEIKRLQITTRIKELRQRVERHNEAIQKACQEYVEVRRAVGMDDKAILLDAYNEFRSKRVPNFPNVDFYGIAQAVFPNNPTALACNRADQLIGLTN